MSDVSSFPTSSTPAPAAEAGSSAAAPASQETLAVAPPDAGASTPASPSTAELAAQVGQLTALVSKLVTQSAPRAPVEAPSVTIKHLSASEVPKLGAFIDYKGRLGVVLEVLSSERTDKTGTWTQYSCRVGLFREAHLVDAEQLSEI